MTDDAQLLRQYVETGSEAAFSELVQRHVGIVYHAAARQLGSNRHLAKDVVQAVFVALAGKSRSLLKHTSLAGWLHTTTHYKVARMLRTERRRQLRELSALQMKDLAPGSSAEWEQIRLLLDDVLLELNASEREAVLLRFFENCPFTEIGARLKLTEGAAHKRVERAREKLRGRLARHGVTSTGAALAAMLGAQAAPAVPAGLAAAVTSAVVTSGLPLALGGLTFMSTKIAVGLTAALALTFAGGVATYEAQTKRPGLGLDALAVTPRGEIALQDKSCAENESTVSAHSAEPNFTVARSVLAVGRADAVSDSTVRRLSAQQRAMLEKRYEALLRQLGLNDSDSAVLLNLLLDRLNIAADLTAGGQQSGGPTRQTDPVHFAEAVERAKAEIDARISTLLGPERFTVYQAFDKDRRSQITVDNLQKLLTPSGTPLTPEQSSALREALTVPGTLQFGVRQVTDEVIAGAAAYLSPEQLAGLRQLQHKQQEGVRAKVLLSEKEAAQIVER
jgi:RNA polymerase sigma factor (sigma-70 family)